MALLVLPSILALFWVIGACMRFREGGEKGRGSSSNGTTNVTTSSDTSGFESFPEFSRFDSSSSSSGQGDGVRMVAVAAGKGKTSKGKGKAGKGKAGKGKGSSSSAGGVFAVPLDPSAPLNVDTFRRVLFDGESDGAGHTDATGTASSATQTTDSSSSTTTSS